MFSSWVESNPQRGTSALQLGHDLFADPPVATTARARTVDAATCFGVYYLPEHACLISHGELEIARLSLSGEIVWSAGGKDIFSEGFRLSREYVEAIGRCSIL